MGVARRSGRLAADVRARRAGWLTNAINSLAHRIATGGLDPELLRIDPALEAYHSPFLAPHDEVAAWLRGAAILTARFRWRGPQKPA